MDFSPANAGLQDHVYLHSLLNSSQLSKCHQISLPQGLLPVTKFGKMMGLGLLACVSTETLLFHYTPCPLQGRTQWCGTLDVLCDLVKNKSVHAGRFHHADPMHSQFLYSAIIISTIKQGDLHRNQSHSGRAIGELFHDMHSWKKNSMSPGVGLLI